jgi:hypothetical protein
MMPFLINKKNNSQFSIFKVADATLFHDHKLKF